MKEVREEVWILTSPDNGHWNRELAIEELVRIARDYGVEVVFTRETRDCGFGQEEKFLLEGLEESVSSVIEEVNESLY